MINGRSGRAVMLGLIAALGVGQAQSKPPVKISNVHCKDFSTYQQALAYFKYGKKHGWKVGNLDRDGDNLPCECLPGGPGEGKPNCR